MLDVHELTVFLIAAETQNFSEAARQLNLTQPAVSMQIKALEKKLNISLFHRTGRTLVLTESGITLVPMAKDIVRRSIQISEEMEAIKGDVTGHLIIGCSTTTGKYYLPSLVARFRKRFPRVQVTIRNKPRTDVLEDLCDSSIHLAVVSSMPNCSDAQFLHFFDDHVVLVVPTDHPWASRESIAPQELLGVNFIMRDKQSGTREEVEAAFQRVGLMTDQLKEVMEIGNTEAIAIAVEEGIGVAFISRTVARRGIELGRIKEVRVEGLALRREIYIAHSIRHPATRAQSEFWDFIQESENATFLQLAA